MADTEKPCECRWDTSQSDMIVYCPLHSSAPDGLKLAKAVLALDADTCFRPKVSKWQEIVLSARRVVEAAEPKGE